MPKVTTDVNINAAYSTLDFKGREIQAAKRKALAGEVLKRFADLGLTVETAKDVLALAERELQASINSCSVGLVRKHRPYQ